MYLGVDWYPEQWGMELVEDDLDGICELGCNIVRIGDFAWDIFEPREGVYDFSFFDEIIARIKRRGLSILMCVPTATMPRWLSKRYPDVMSEREDGTRTPYGARRGYCMNSAVYIEKACALACALTSHYRDESAIVAWQIDNEIGHEESDECWCESCTQGFTRYLSERYGDISELNSRWGTHFWSQTYDDFSDIPLPRKAHTPHNPSLRMEWERFRSHSVQEYLNKLYNAVKETAPNAVVLHDFSGGLWSKHFDPFAAARVLDIAAYNHYPVWGAQPKPIEPARAAFALDTARGLKGNAFWVTEALIGSQGHDMLSCSPKPGEAAIWAVQALAHGCSSLLFFRYRGYNRGAEQFCFGILDADNQKRRKFFEVKDLLSRIKKHEEVFAAPIHNDAAIIYDYDSAAAFRIQPQSDIMDYENEAFKLYEQLWQRNIGADIVNADEVELSDYKLVLIPVMTVMGESFKRRLKSYVSHGGTAVLTFRSAWKDKDDNFIFGDRLPSGLTALAGVVIEEHETLLTGQSRCVVTPNGDAGIGSVFCEMLSITTADTLLSWSPCDFGNYAAATRNSYGTGTCYYLGSSFDEALTTQIFDDVISVCGLTPSFSGKNIETILKNVGSEESLITLNYSTHEYEFEKL